MKKLIKICSILIIILLCAESKISYSQSLHLYGGRDHDVYLGCLTCSKYESSSIWNTYNTYGSSYNSTSIWNKYGTYGSSYSNYSPFDTYASYPPAVVDKNGNFYGYLTISSYKSNRCTLDIASIIYEYYEKIREDVPYWYDKIF